MMQQDPALAEERADEQARDAELVAKCQRGDTAAFNELVTKYRNKVYSTIFNLVRNEDDAWDLTQETFLKAWRNIAGFRSQSSFFTWIYRIATNVTLDWLRKKQIASGVEFDDAVEITAIAPGAATAPRIAPLPHQQLQNREIQSRIEASLAQLSAEHRMAVVLREVEGLSYEEIAEASSCTVGTVMSRLFYARKKLQTLLRDVYESI